MRRGASLFQTKLDYLSYPVRPEFIVRMCLPVKFTSDENIIEKNDTHPFSVNVKRYVLQ